jgi:hypothetical protein
MSNNYERSLEAIKAKNGGELPSDLYMKTIRELKDLLISLGGYGVSLSGSKEALVKRLQRLQGLPTKAPAENRENTRPANAGAAAPAPSAIAAKPTTTCHLSQGQIVELRRVMRLTDETHSTLRPLWYKVGMTSLYPHRSGKDLVIGRMKAFAERQLKANGVPM